MFSVVTLYNITYTQYCEVPTLYYPVHSAVVLSWIYHGYMDLVMQNINIEITYTLGVVFLIHFIFFWDID